MLPDIRKHPTTIMTVLVNCLTVVSAATLSHSKKGSQLLPVHIDVAMGSWCHGFPRLRKLYKVSAVGSGNGQPFAHRVQARWFASLQPKSESC